MTILFRNRAELVQRSDPAMDAINSRRIGSMSSTSYRYVPMDAFKIAAVVACVGMRAGAFAQLPLKSYREENGIGQLVVPQPELLRRPSEVVAASVWKTQMSISRDIWGWAAGLIKAVDGAGYVSKVDWLLPGAVITAQELTDGQIDWRIQGQPVDPMSILHVPSRWVLPGRPLGISPLEYSGLVDLARKAQEFGRDWFTNGAVPSSVIYSEQALQQEQADGIVNTILAKWQSRKPAVLGSGLKYEKISVPANESQFLDTMRQASSDIAVSFNLPPERVNAAITKGNEYANISQNLQQYLVDSINPDLVVICEVLDGYQRPDQYCQFNTGAFLRSDLKTRYESYDIAIAAGFLTVDEVRALEERPPLKPDTPGGAE